MATKTTVVFDVNETLTDLSSMAQRFGDVGSPPLLAKVWFASLLRDGFALTAAGGRESFATIGESVLRQALSSVDLNRSIDEAVDHILGGFVELPIHPDIVAGVRALRAAGLRLVTLTNGSTRIAERLFTTAGIRDDFEALLSVDEAPAWKPARTAYEFAAQRCGTGLAEILLVAVHPWDINGAASVGMATAWIDRTGQPYPGYFASPTYTVSTLTELPGKLHL